MSSSVATPLRLPRRRHRARAVPGLPAHRHRLRCQARAPRVLPGAFSLGRWASPVFAAALVWLVFAVLALSLPAEFHKVVYVAGGVVLAALWWLLVLRPRFAAGTAGPAVVPAATPR